MYKQSAVERQRLVRQKISAAAYGYEIANDPIMSDSEYDRLALEVDPSINTGREDIDDFFKECYSPNSGLWIYKHPELDKVSASYSKWKQYSV